ncbi:MAG: hypothetical protein JWM11_5686 [Planctomycetaceae bacterium]|nr:hypothetical protein [Planctomycetaceae bacterium]
MRPQIVVSIGQSGRHPFWFEFQKMTDPIDDPVKLPAYTHIPGVTPHPTGDPRGHSFGHLHANCPAPDWQTLPACELFQYGCRLFNAGYYWEAHEAWEGVWIAAGRKGLVADFVKGLIKLAAAGVKLREASPIGVQRHLTRAEELLMLTRRLLSEQDPDKAKNMVDVQVVLDPASHRETLVGQALELVQKLKRQLPAIPEPQAGRPLPLLGSLEP